MSCMVMKYESLAALANAVEARLNCDYNFWGFDAPDSLYRAFEDCRTVRLYSAEDIYNRLYTLNVQAYNERYKNHEETAADEAPIIDGSRYIIHHRPEYWEHGFAVRPWHYYLAPLLDCWLYQTLEGVVRNDPQRLAMRDFRDSLYGFIIRNSPPYTAMRLGELPLFGMEKAQREAVYYINTVPGEAAVRKGHADFPEDFPHLRPGENFTVWRVGENWEVETTLSGEPLFTRLKAIKDQENSEQVREFQYILSFAEERCFDTELACSQLRSLWTAFCLRHGLDVDTVGYDRNLLGIWTKIADTEYDTAYWSDYDSFGHFMCAELV